MFDDLNPVVLFRMSERLLMTGIVIVVAIVVLIGFWKTVQRITLKDGGPLGVAGSVALSTPVFALLSIILYAWVSLSHPISYSPASPDTRVALAETAPGGGVGQFTGALSTGSEDAAPADVDAAARRATRDQVRTINCLIAHAGQRATALNDLTEVKLTLMRGVWSEDWGNRPQFVSWARNPASQYEPNAAVLAFFEGRHTGC